MNKAESLELKTIANLRVKYKMRHTGIRELTNRGLGHMKADLFWKQFCHTSDLKCDIIK